MEITKKEYFVYILECADKTLYIGSTTDIEKRLHGHNNLKSGAKYTKARRPLVLVHLEKCRSWSDALRREWQIKKLSRNEKISLFARDSVALK